MSEDFSAFYSCLILWFCRNIKFPLEELVLKDTLHVRVQEFCSADKTSVLPRQIIRTTWGLLVFTLMHFNFQKPGMRIRILCFHFGKRFVRKPKNAATLILNCKSLVFILKLYEMSWADIGWCHTYHRIRGWKWKMDESFTSPQTWD